MSHNADKKLEGGTLWDFSTSILPQNIKKLKGTLWGKIFEKKSHPLVSPGFVLRGKRGKPFWFSSLGQMIQFGTMKFRRTFRNYFGQLVWIEKKSL